MYLDFCTATPAVRKAGISFSMRWSLSSSGNLRYQFVVTDPVKRPLDRLPTSITIPDK